MDQYVYIKILEENLKPSTDQLGLTGDFTFQQDNDPKHTAGNALMYIAYKTPRYLRTPPQSPDLNPIEHMWDVLVRRLRRHQVTARPT